MDGTTSVHTLKVGIVGSGMAGVGLHLPAYRKVAGVDVVCLIDQDTTRAGDVARQNGVERVFGSIEEAIAAGPLHAVSICTPPETHLPLASTAMRNGIDVLMEKPLTASLDEADQLRKVQLETGRKLSVVHQFKWGPGIAAVREMQRAGTIGEPVHLQMIWFRDGAEDRMISQEGFWANQLRGGRWEECIPHLFYLAYGFVGPMKIVDVRGRTVGGRFPWLRADEVQVTLESGTGYVTIRFSANMEQRKYEKNFLYGSRGNAVFDHAHAAPLPDLPIGALRLARGVRQKSSGLANRVLIKAGVRERPVGSPLHDTVVHRFVEHVRSGAAPPTDWDEAYHVMELTDAYGARLQALASQDAAGG